MALGAGSVTPLQMATAYGVFANGGYRVNPILISQHHRQQGPACSTSPSPPPLDESARTLDARNAFVMTSLLQEVTRSGTAAGAQATLKRPDIYGKTGTTNDSMDAWFAGWQTQRGGGGLDGLRQRRASWATAKPAAVCRCRSGSTT